MPLVSDDAPPLPPWHEQSMVGTDGSVNDPDTRDPGHDLNVPIKSNYINIDGTAGVYVAPVYDLGKGTCA